MVLMQTLLLHFRPEWFGPLLFLQELREVSPYEESLVGWEDLELASYEVVIRLHPFSEVQGSD